MWIGSPLLVISIVERLVPDELRELFQRVVPEAPTLPQECGRRRHGDREVLAAIVFVATSGCTWQQLPSASFGPSGATAHRRFAAWTKAGVWARLHRLVLDELGARGELDRSRCAIDAVNMRALKRGTCRRRRPPSAGSSRAGGNSRTGSRTPINADDVVSYQATTRSVRAPRVAEADLATTTWAPCARRSTVRKASGGAARLPLWTRCGKDDGS
ncbi:transposase [Streptomyces nigra]|uniref:transposase n=1 Tax=Streptomyces nigra TaxID=1827580 RepID=UPI0036954A68